MICICEQYAKTHSITFNLNKSKLLCYNVDEADDIPPIYLNGKVIPSVGSDKHCFILTMMKEHRYSSKIKSIRLQTSLYGSVSQSATPSRLTRLQSELHFCAESPHDISY